MEFLEFLPTLKEAAFEKWCNQNNITDIETAVLCCPNACWIGSLVSHLDLSPTKKVNESLIRKACILAIERIEHLMNAEAKKLFSRIKDIENSECDILQRIKDKVSIERDIERYYLSFDVANSDSLQEYCAAALLDFIHKNIKEAALSISNAYSEQISKYTFIEDLIHFNEYDIQPPTMRNTRSVSIAQTAEIYKQILGGEIVRLFKAMQESDPNNIVGAVTDKGAI